jgi:hypothetical protein
MLNKLSLETILCLDIRLPGTPIRAGLLYHYMQILPTLFLLAFQIYIFNFNESSRIEIPDSLIIF